MRTCVLLVKDQCHVFWCDHWLRVTKVDVIQTALFPALYPCSRWDCNTVLKMYPVVGGLGRVLSSEQFSFVVGFEPVSSQLLALALFMLPTK